MHVTVVDYRELHFETIHTESYGAWVRTFLANGL